MRANAAYLFRNPISLPLIVLAVLLMLALPKLLAPALQTHYRIGLDLQTNKCLPYTLYAFRMGGVDPRLPEGKRFSLERGMMVAFTPQNNEMGIRALDGQRIVKIVAGLPGDTLEVRHDEAYINGKSWGKLWLLSTLGKLPGSFDRKTIVPPGKVLLMGTLKTSYDGRYYGFIDQREIHAQAFALF